MAVALPWTTAAAVGPGEVEEEEEEDEEDEEEERQGEEAEEEEEEEEEQGEEYGMLSAMSYQNMKRTKKL